MKNIVVMLFLLSGATSAAPGQIANGRVLVDDGRIVFDGTFQQLVGIEVISHAGLLSLETIEFPNFGAVALRLPFSLKDGNVLRNTPNIVTLGVFGLDKRIDLEGRTPTSILYAGEAGNVCRIADLTVNVGLGRDGPRRICFIPEPHGGLPSAVGLLCLMSDRRRRIWLDPGPLEG